MKLEFKGKGHATGDDVCEMQPALIIVMGVLLQFCRNHELPLKITNVTQKFKSSVSSTHPEGRAFDVSIDGWTLEDIEECRKYMEAKVGYLGAISGESYKPKIMVHHDVGLGDHLHFQVARDVYLSTAIRLP